MLGHETAETGGVFGDVAHHQVGDGRSRRAHSEVDGSFARQLSDQKRETAEVAPQPTVLRVAVESLNPGVQFAQQHSRADHVGRQSTKEVGGGYRGPQPAPGDNLQRVVEDPQLRPELTVPAASVHRLETRLPEAAPGRQQGVVLDPVTLVLRPRPDPRVLEVPRDLTGVGLEQLLDRRNGGRLLAQQHLAGHGLDIGVRQFDADDEPVAQFRQVRRIG